MVVIDPTSELRAKAAGRLETQTLGWLTTVYADGTPRPNPMGFETQLTGTWRARPVKRRVSDGALTLMRRYA